MIRLTPTASGPVPILLWLHSAVGDADEFAAEAAAFPSALSILPEAPYAKSRRSSRSDEIWLQTAEELSAALDQVSGSWEIDWSRSAAIGRNLGGSQIAYWLTREPRISRAIITGSVPELSRYWEESPHPRAVAAREADGWRRGLERTREFDLIRSVARLGAKSLLLQFGTKDDWIQTTSVEHLCAIADPRLHRIEWLDDDHDMGRPEAIASRAAWLATAKLL